MEDTVTFFCYLILNSLEFCKVHIDYLSTSIVGAAL